jgi:hypothetical protein
LQTYVYIPDPRYSIGIEWVLCSDKVRRPRYKALFDGCTIGEIMPSFQRDVVLADLQALIDAGGVGRPEGGKTHD